MRGYYNYPNPTNWYLQKDGKAKKNITSRLMKNKMHEVVHIYPILTATMPISFAFPLEYLDFAGKEIK